MLSFNLTPRQEAAAKALVATGYFGNVSEVGRAAIEALVRGLSVGRRRRVAYAMAQAGALDVLGMAEMGDLGLEEAERLCRQARPRPGKRGPGARPGPLSLSEFRRRLRAHGVQERLFHMTAYRDASPGARMLAGAALSEAARRPIAEAADG